MKNILTLIALCMAVMISTAAFSADRTTPTINNIENYARQVFIRGVPYEQTSKVDPAAIPILLNMLNDPKEKAYWANVVVILEMIGDDSVVNPLIEFIERDFGSVMSQSVYVAKTSAVMGLGYLINKTGNQQALDYLMKGVNPQQWQARSITGLVGYHMSTEERNQDMSQYAILGLALSGHPAAAQTLQMLQQPAVDAKKSAFQQQVADLIAGALDANIQIAENGLVKYYQNAKK